MIRFEPTETRLTSARYREIDCGVGLYTQVNTILRMTFNFYIDFRSLFGSKDRPCPSAGSDACMCHFVSCYCVQLPGCAGNLA